MSTATEIRRQRIHEVHEHLRHAATTDAPDEIRERMRRAELALQRAETEQSGAGPSEEPDTD